MVGTEPANVNSEPRQRLRREGRLPRLVPGEKRRHELQFQVLSSVEEIQAVEKETRFL